MSEEILPFEIQRMEVERLDGEIKALESTIGEQSEAFDEKLREIQNFTDSITEAENRHSILQRDGRRQEELVDQTAADLETVTSRIERLRDQVERAGTEEERAARHRELADAENRIGQLEQMRVQAETQVDELSRSIQEITQSIPYLITQRTQAEAEKVEIEAPLNQNRKTLESLKQQRMTSAVIANKAHNDELITRAKELRIELSSILYGFMTFLGLIYSFLLYKTFDIDIFDYADLFDFFLAGLSKIGIILIPVIIVAIIGITMFISTKRSFFALAILRLYTIPKILIGVVVGIILIFVTVWRVGIDANTLLKSRVNVVTASPLGDIDMAVKIGNTANYAFFIPCKKGCKQEVSQIRWLTNIIPAKDKKNQDYLVVPINKIHCIESSDNIEQMTQDDDNQNCGSKKKNMTDLVDLLNNKVNDFVGLVSVISSNTQLTNQRIQAIADNQNDLNKKIDKDRQFIKSIGYQDSLITYTIPFDKEDDSLGNGSEINDKNKAFIAQLVKDIGQCRYHKRQNSIGAPNNSENVWFHIIGYSSSSDWDKKTPSMSRYQNIQTANQRAINVATLMIKEISELAANGNDTTGMKITVREWKSHLPESETGKSQLYDEYELMRHKSRFIDFYSKNENIEHPHSGDREYIKERGFLTRRVDIQLMRAGYCTMEQIVAFN